MVFRMWKVNIQLPLHGYGILSLESLFDSCLCVNACVPTRFTLVDTLNAKMGEISRDVIMYYTSVCNITY